MSAKFKVNNGFTKLRYSIEPIVIDFLTACVKLALMKQVTILQVLKEVAQPVPCMEQQQNNDKHNEDNRHQRQINIEQKATTQCKPRFL